MALDNHTDEKSNSGDEETENDENDDTENSNNENLIINELLCYAQFHLHQAPRENIEQVITRHFSQVEILKAKNTLAKNYKDCFSYELKDKRNTRRGKNIKVKQKFETTAEDILSFYMNFTIEI